MQQEERRVYGASSPGDCCSAFSSSETGDGSAAGGGGGDGGERGLFVTPPDGNSRCNLAAEQYPEECEGFLHLCSCDPDVPALRAPCVLAALTQFSSAPSFSLPSSRAADRRRPPPAALASP